MNQKNRKIASPKTAIVYSTPANTSTKNQLYSQIQAISITQYSIRMKIRRIFGQVQKHFPLGNS